MKTILLLIVVLLVSACNLTGPDQVWQCSGAINQAIKIFGNDYRYVYSGNSEVITWNDGTQLTFIGDGSDCYVL